MAKNIDITIIGGGFFGLYLAYYFSRLNKKVLVIEKESKAMQRASFSNQARVHNGYHYPRSVLTALRSRVSFPRFVDEFNCCIESDFDKYYMISNRLGHITANQFEKFCDRINASYELASESIRRLVQPNMIDGVYKVKEYAFNTVLLRQMMCDRIQNSGVGILYNHTVRTVKQSHAGDVLELSISSDSETFNITSKQVFNCTYSLLNKILFDSGLELIPLKHEMTEMCIVDAPDELQNIGVTVMCGPFFSIMPFPSLKSHSFSHVRYTPHYEWSDHQQSNYINADDVYRKSNKRSAFRKMILDAQRYIPMMKNVKYKDSLWEVKTILPRSDSDDSRPILFKVNYGLPGFHSVMGGKIDNVYDVIHIINNLGLDT